jgi:hypothetical protein
MFLIGKYLIGLISAGCEAQRQAFRRSPPYGLSVVGMAHQVHEGDLQGRLSPRHIPPR